MIKKIAAGIILCFVSVAAFPQFMASGTGRSIALTGSSVSNINAVFLFNGITADNQVMYTGTASSYLWTKSDGSFVSNQSSISVEDGTGYILRADTMQYRIWVIDYHNYLPALSSLTVNEGSNKCSTIYLNVSGNIPDLAYWDKNNTRQTLSRQFALSYADMEYTNNQWTTLTRTQTVTAPLSSISIDAPYENTVFQISGDQYARQFGLSYTVSSNTYTAVRTECHLTGSIIERNAPNEIGRTISTLNGSGPLNVSFTSNANVPATQFYEWTINNVSTPANYLRYTDTNLRYIFTTTGTYRVTLTTYNSDESCTYTDSVTVTVSGSHIEIPNVFTPNGDGKNDEFRVAYQSIATFQMVIYSSWAGRVYISTDPAEGWDGRVNGKLQPPGVYYYIITATGTDGTKFKFKGNINLLRNK